MVHAAVAKFNNALFNIAQSASDCLADQITMLGVGKFEQCKVLVLGLGANIAGPWGTPHQTLMRACQELDRSGISIVSASNFYCTKPVSDIPQPVFLNAVVLAKAYIAPGALLRLLKQLERRAGRRTAPAMTRRSLDIDVLDYGGRRIGLPSPTRERGRLVLPHPELHKRAFVLVPLLQVAPAWRHPALGSTVKTLLMRLSPAERASVRQALDSPADTCEKRAS